MGLSGENVAEGKLMQHLLHGPIVNLRGELGMSSPRGTDPERKGSSRTTDYYRGLHSFKGRRLTAAQPQRWGKLQDTAAEKRAIDSGYMYWLLMTLYGRQAFFSMVLFLRSTTSRYAICYRERSPSYARDYYARGPTTTAILPP